MCLQHAWQANQGCSQRSRHANAFGAAGTTVCNDAAGIVAHTEALRGAMKIHMLNEITQCVPVKSMFTVITMYEAGAAAAADRSTFRVYIPHLTL
jgi:hypothetical protein